MIRYLLLTMGVLLASTALWAQQDSIGLRLDRLGRGDIEFDNEEQRKQRVVSASRTLKTVDELPFTIYVVSKEEIFSPASKSKPTALAAKRANSA
ncbi:MAG: hypothetical protein AAF985_17615, partial [Bacteroidota bacterium]